MLLCLKSAGRTSVTLERLDCMVQSALHLGVKLLMFELFAGNPLRGGNQRGLFFQMA
jgi:hypothetical protein